MISSLSPLKKANLDHSPFVSLNYWSTSQDTCVAECRATWAFDMDTRRMVWDLFAEGPEPVGYDPSIIPGWESPTAPAFAGWRLEPTRLRVMPASVLRAGTGQVLTWTNRAAGRG